MQTYTVLNSLEDTGTLARKIADTINGGEILALSGPIGAGKTTFTKAFAAALGVAATVVSPTYTLLQPYELPRAIRGITTLIHIDAYRLENADELRAIGFEDFLHDPSKIILIEWAENVEKLLQGQKIYWLKFEITDRGREVTITN